jgi:hypothetical protein
VNDSQGAKATEAGERLKRFVASQLEVKGFVYNPGKTFGQFCESPGLLFAAAGQYAVRCHVPLRAPYHAGSRFTALADFLIRTAAGQLVCLAIKCQESGGTAEERLEFKVMNLLATGLPVAVFVHGPLAGRDAETGFSPEVLYPIWQRVQHHGRLRVYLFRHEDRLGRWIADGLPMSVKPHEYDGLCANYCDPEP